MNKRTRLKINTLNSDHTLSTLNSYLYVRSAVLSMKLPEEFKYTYLCVLLFLKASNIVYVTSPRPGHFNPFSFDFRPHWCMRLYQGSLRHLSQLGMIKRMQKGEYIITEQGESIYRSYLRTLDHKIGRTSRKPTPTE